MPIARNARIRGGELDGENEFRLEEMFVDADWDDMNVVV
jgi:hypothetical protein